jgi:hypothetical protein
MTWQPISESELESQLQLALKQMSDVETQKFAAVRTPLFRVPCRRPNQAATEMVFAVARSGTKLLVFDDVEDEFAVTEFSDVPGYAVENWELLGDLATALRKI